MQEHTENKPTVRHSAAKRTVFYIALLIAGFFLFIGLYVHFQFPDISFDQFLYNMSQPWESVEMSIRQKAVVWVVFPAVFVSIFVYKVCVKSYRKHAPHKKKRLVLGWLAFVVGFAACFATFFTQCRLDEYLLGLQQSNALYETYYVDPSGVNYTFPEQKKNLIYIVMESMELSYADEENGGALDHNLIPELTALRSENTSFSIEGSQCLSALSWTMTSLTAQTSGVNNRQYRTYTDVNNNETVLPGSYGIGNILEDAGYANVFLLGSDADYDHRTAYFTSHGNYEIRDLKWAKETGRIPQNYNVYWGYEDEKLYEYARETLEELSSSEQPFNLTMLTVDTHFPDGYLCDLCPDDEEMQYENVIRCADHQVGEFVRWCQSQDWYEDTIIVISGDHNTMDTCFDDIIDEDYNRTVFYTIINSVCTPQRNDERVSTVLDLYPTTLHALGVAFDSDRLGLGTDLYSSSSTLCEELGSDDFAIRLAAPSTFYTSHLVRSDSETSSSPTIASTSP